jgi:predicted transcriptional regulator
MKLNKTDKLVLDALKDGELTLQEIADKTGEKSKKIFKVLRKLFEHELVDTKARKYKLSHINSHTKPLYHTTQPLY